MEETLWLVAECYAPDGLIKQLHELKRQAQELHDRQRQFKRNHELLRNELQKHKEHRAFARI